MDVNKQNFHLSHISLTRVVKVKNYDYEWRRPGTENNALATKILPGSTVLPWQQSVSRVSVDSNQYLLSYSWSYNSHWSTCKPHDVKILTVVVVCSEPIWVSCFGSSNVHITRTNYDMKKRSTPFIHVFHAFWYEQIKIFILYPF